MTLTSLRKLALVLLFVAGIFEPSDRVFGLKIYVFSLFVLLGIVALFVDENVSMPSFPQLLYVFTLALLFPAWGLTVSLVFNPGNLGTDGLQYFKSHLFLIFSLFLSPLNLLGFAEKTFITLLVVLAHVIIALFLISLVVPPPVFDAILVFGRQTNLFLLGEREYGGVHFPTMYYVTAPLLVFCLAYFLERASKKVDERTVYLILVSVAGLFLSGTRNNILISLLIPAYYFLHHRPGRLVLSLALPIVLVLAAGVLRSMFDPQDVSNATKIAYLVDYSAILTDPKTLLLGQGLGTRFFASGLGEVVSITELSYFEIVRTYGIIVGVAFFLYLIYPLILLVRSRDPKYYFTVGYAAYLLGSYSNPYLLSSSGMMVLGLVVAMAFQPKSHHSTVSL
jgi:hypothetical protein